MACETSIPFHVLIVGAGSTGLLIAQGLKKAGISYQVYERESTYTYQNRQREWGMTLHWGAQNLGRCLPEDIQARLTEARADPFLDLTGEDASMNYFNGKTGELLFKAGNDFMTRISRSKLRNLLSEGIKIKFNKTLVKVHDEGSTVRVAFEDGEEAVGNLLIGSEGGRSVTREYLLGDAGIANRRKDLVFFNFTQRYDAETALVLDSLHPLIKFALHPDGHGMMVLAIQDRVDPAKPETWLFQIVASWLSSDGEEVNVEPQERLEMVKGLAKHFSDPWRSAVFATKEDTHIPQDHLSWWEPIPWNNHCGKVTLAGDAAHPMMPYRGQGLNNALEDAVSLVDAVTRTALNGVELSKTISCYEDEMIPRGREEVRRSNQQCDASLSFKSLTESPLMKHGVQRVPQEGATIRSVDVAA